MLRFLADENLNGAIMRGLLRHSPTLDIVRVQDVGLMGKDDPVVLEWAADHNRVLLTQDVSTITKYAYNRLQSGNSMPGVVEIGRNIPIGLAIQDLLLLAECGEDADLVGQILYLPLR